MDKSTEVLSEQKNTDTPADPPPSYEAASSKPAAPSGPGGGLPRPRMPLPLNLPALNMLRGKRVILASASPRRKQILAQIGFGNLEIIPSTFAEDLSKSMSPFEYVLQTAQEKALDVYRREVDNTAGGLELGIIIAADTVVVSYLGAVLEKPRSEREHVAVLKELRDDPDGQGWHKVCTAVVCVAPLEDAVEPGYAMETHVEETSVKFDPNVTDDLILAYVRTREGADKAGGYGIQGIGSILVERIEGTFDNVVGLPLRATLQLIEKTLTPEEDLEDKGTDEDSE